MVVTLPDPPIPPSAEEIISYLGMERIPDEEAWFRQTYKSADVLTSESCGGRYATARTAGTAIYALITREGFSAMHRLQTDEIWHFYLGTPLELLLLHPDGSGELVMLGPDLLNGQHPQWVVPRGVWMGAIPIGETSSAYSLIGNTMAPGFEYADFEIGYRDELQARYPEFATQIAKLTSPPHFTRIT